MNNQNDSSDEFESLLKSQASVLLRMKAQPQELSPAELDAIKKKLEEIHPFLRVLAKSQMVQVILQIFKTAPMDGSDLAAMLRKSNVKLKDASGEGEIFGLLRELEYSKLIAAEWKDGDERRKKVYKLTDLGRAEISPVTSKEAELAQWLLSRSAA